MVVVHNHGSNFELFNATYRTDVEADFVTRVTALRECDACERKPQIFAVSNLNLNLV